MSKRNLREWARFDVDFLESEEYLRMPAGIRNAAYLFLLALSGRSRKRRTDGLLPMVVAEELARRIGRPLEPMLAALGARHVALVRVRKGKVHVLKYSKWQQTKSEIEEVQAQKRDAGRLGGIQKAANKRLAEVKQMPSREPSRSLQETEREKERDLSLPYPSLVDKSVDGTGTKVPRRLEMPSQGYRGGEMTKLLESLPKIAR